MTTAAQRLVALSGLPSGTAAAHLMARATSPGNAGQRLVAISGLAIGTAAAHLLAVGQLATTPLPSAEIAARTSSTVIQAEAEGGAQAEAQADVIRLEASSDDAKLTTEAGVARLLATPSEAKLVATYRTATLTYIVGQLLKFANRQDAATVTDSAFRETGKAIGEQLSVTDTVFRGAGKQVADSAGVSVSARLIYTKGAAEAASVSDVTQFSAVKAALDGATVSDSKAVVLSKSLFDNVFVTHDEDGAASVEDDQEFQMFKQINRAVFVADQLSIVAGYVKKPADSVTVDVSGFLISQGYCDITYFASDYVGQSRTFT